MSNYLLGIDIGTGGSKAVLIDEQGNVAANVTTEYPLSTPRALWSEQNPQDWYIAAITSIAKVLEQSTIDPSKVAAIGLTGQMHGLVLLDVEGEVLRPAILWNDHRTAAQCDEIHDRVGLDNVLRITGKPALTGFTAPKILWVRLHEPDVYSRATKMLLPKDYIRYRLSGEFFSDVSDASGTSLFDVSTRQWSPEMIETLDVPRDWLPQVTESAVVSANLSAEAANVTGLSQGTPIVGGAGDQAAEAIGCGIVDDGAVSVTIGTSGVVFAATKSCQLDPHGQLHAYCHAIPGMWHLMGVMLSAGGSLRWFRDTLGGEEITQAVDRSIDPYDVLIEGASRIQPGCEGLFFLPYLTGERTPHADPNARGAFIGLTLRHSKQHMTRAVMEGVTFGLMDSLQLVREMGINTAKVRVSGGGARSAVWRQMMADVFDAEVATVNSTQGAAYGAAILASVGIGLYPDVSQATERIVRETASDRPGANAQVYRRFHEQYRALYPALKSHFSALVSLAEP